MILHELIATTKGALAALFLDWEGETVELVCEHAECVAAVQASVIAGEAWV